MSIPQNPKMAILAANNLNTNQVTVGMTATLIAPANLARQAVAITNLGTVDVFLGSSASVTSSTGDLLAGSKGSFVIYGTTTPIYGIVAAGSQAVSWSETF